MFFGSNKDKPENQLPQYTKSQDNMRYGTYTDPKFEETLQNPVTDATLKEAFKNVEDGLDEFLPAFKDTIAKDTNSINEHSMEFDKKTIRYYLATSELKNLILAAHQKYFPSEAKLKDYVSPEKVTDNYLKELSDFKPEVKNQYKDDCRAKIKREVGFSFKKAKEILDSNDKPGKTLMQNTLNFIDNRISDLFEKMKAFQSLESYENEDSDTFKKNQIVLLDFLIALQKIYTMAIAVSYSFKTPENDLYNLEPNAKEWEPLKSKYERITFPDDLERIKKQNEEDVEKYQKTMTVLSNNCFDTDSDAMKAWNLTKFGVLKDKTDLGMEIEWKKSLLSDDLGKSFKGITRLIKNGAVKMGMRPRLPSLEFKRKIYLKKLYKDIDRDLLYEILDKVKANQEFKMEDLKRPQKQIEKEEKKEVPKELWYDSVKKEFKPYFVSTRMLNKTNVKFPKDQPSILTTVFGKMEEPVKYRDALILHIHGGGFVGSSTFGSEMFLRQWTNNLDIPILGIDYCLSPENQYPAALNDCWQAYHWILENAEKEFAIKPKRIILSGNDAGGNLALALTYLLIATGQRVPDMLLTFYPPCDVNSKTMTTSFLKAFEDNAPLSPASMLYASFAYRGDYENEEDCFLNLWKVTEGILKKMPKTRMFLGDQDPLRDTGIKTAAKIAKSAPDFKVYDFEGLMHAFLQEKSPLLSGVPNKIVCEELDEYLKASKEEEKEEEYVAKERQYPQELLDALKKEEEERKRQENTQRLIEAEKKRREEEDKKKKEEEFKKREEQRKRDADEKKRKEEEEKKKKEAEEKKKSEKEEEEKKKKEEEEKKAAGK